MELIPAPSVAFEAGCRTETIAVVEKENLPTEELSHSLLVFKSKSMQMSTYKITGFSKFHSNGDGDLGLGLGGRWCGTRRGLIRSSP